MKYAELIDAYRVFPRIVLMLFVLAVGTSLDWYLSYEIQFTRACDVKVLTLLLDKDIELDIAKGIACPITEVIERPSGYTFLLSTLIGSSAAIFGFYLNSGRRWGRNNE